MSRQITDLVNALVRGDEVAQRLAGKTPAVFLDYDGTLTPIVDRPEDALISPAMRETVRELATRCPVCVVSGRDRPVVQELMGLNNLIVAGSHGFDIWSPDGGNLQREEGRGHQALIEAITAEIRTAVAGIEGALIEPKRASVAVHYRLVDEVARPQIAAVVEQVLAAHPNALKLTPGKMVYEIQPRLNWDKGKAVLYLLEALGLNRSDVTPLYLGDDHTDEHAFAALSGRGIGIFVGSADDPEVAGRTTEAEYILANTQEVEQFLASLARETSV
jgi:trehalose 6-phosphate phosphatase